MDLIEGKEGRWWAVFLGVRPVFAKAQEHGVDLMPTHLGRETFLAPLEWIDGWPVVNGRKPVELIGEARGLSLVPEFPTWIDNFDSDSKSYIAFIHNSDSNMQFCRTSAWMVPYPNATPPNLLSHRAPRFHRHSRISIPDRSRRISGSSASKTTWAEHGFLD